MADALLGLERILRTSEDKLTLQEEHVLQTCKSSVVRDSTFGALVASSVMWTATRRLGYGYRLNLSGGAAFLCGMWRFHRSLISCLDQILSWEGSRMQTELANLILTKHRDDPWKMQLVNKHFYSEKVFDDSNLDQPLSRWRHRHLSGESVVHRTHDSNTSSNQKPDLGPQQFTRSSVEDDVADPLDCILGYSGIAVEVPFETITVPKRGRARSHKRAHRRHRAHRSELSANYARPQNML